MTRILFQHLQRVPYSTHSLCGLMPHVRAVLPSRHAFRPNLTPSLLPVGRRVMSRATSACAAATASWCAWRARPASPAAWRTAATARTRAPTALQCPGATSCTSPTVRSSWRSSSTVRSKSVRMEVGHAVPRLRAYLRAGSQRRGMAKARSARLMGQREQSGASCPESWTGGACAYMHTAACTSARTMFNCQRGSPHR